MHAGEIFNFQVGKNNQVYTGYVTIISRIGYVYIFFQCDLFMYFSVIGKC